MTVATAGHVDHGKSTLIEALTSIHPDRLAEEQARGMTIDLGFAWFTLPSGRDVSIVDVPGHERFVHNMLAGVGGVDAVLLVVAADEGVMPQTREHLDIIDLLDVDAGVVALTKADLVDEEWADLIAEDVRDVLAGRRLAQAPLVRVAAPVGRGLSDLTRALDAVLTRRRRAAAGGARLPVDRVFTMPGFGTVVTGTLAGGELRVGDQPVVVPGGRRVRIRGVQSHREELDAAPPGRRVAVNLSGLSRDQIERGSVLAAPGAVIETRRVDARLRMLASAPRALKPGELAAFHSGTSARVARLRLLEADPIPPGGAGWVQWRLDEPTALRRGDRYVVRRLSPAVTIGGGTIVRAAARHAPRGDPRVLAALERASEGDPASLVRAALARQILPQAEIARRAELDEAVVQHTVAQLQAAGELHALRTCVGAPEVVAHARRDLREALRVYHAHDPGAEGLTIAELGRRVGLPPAAAAELVAVETAAGTLRTHAARVSLAAHQTRLDPAEEQAARRLLAELDAGGFSPPSLKAALAASGASDRVAAALARDGRLILLEGDIALSRAAFDAWLRRVRPLFAGGAAVTVRDVRDTLGASRKYALALLACLDSRSLTRRVGDARRWIGGGGREDI